MFTELHPQLSPKELISAIESLEGLISKYLQINLLNNVKALLGNKEIMFFPQNPQWSSKELIGNIENLKGQISNHLYVDLLNNIKFLVK